MGVKEHSSRASSVCHKLTRTGKASIIGQDPIANHGSCPKTVLFRMSWNGFVQVRRSRQIVCNWSVNVRQLCQMPLVEHATSFNYNGKWRYRVSDSEVMSDRLRLMFLALGEHMVVT
jgi:hypothetical protein